MHELCQNPRLSLVLWETLAALRRLLPCKRGWSRVFLGIVTWKERIFLWRLNRMGSGERERKGCSLSRASSVGLVYFERDHAHFREVKALAKRLKDEFGVKRVGMMSYVHEDTKDTPTWLVKKIGFRLLLQGRLELVRLACQGI